MISGIHAQALFKRYEQLKLIELSKNDLIEDLLRRVSELEDAYHQVKIEHEREVRYNRDIQLHEMELMEQIKRVKKIMDREPFVIVLLDGDKTLFLDQYVRAGEQGGKDAANKLATDMGAYLSENLPNVASPKIVVRIFANLRGLGNTYHQAGIIDKTSVMEDFVRGFNESGLLFDFVDVGQAKTSAEDKISETLKLNIYSCHCHQVYLGCSHTNSYTQLLQETMEDIDLTGRVSLIESIPAEKELDDLKASFRVARFSDVFRDTKISSSPIASVKTPIKAQSAMLSPHPRSASLTRTSTNTSTSSATPTSWSSWASVTASNPGDVTLQSLKPASAAATKTPVVERNKLGQRIDRMDFKSVSKEELSRIKKMKLCNLYYLLGECPNTNCYHDHDYKLSKEEKDVLRAVARMTPCHFGMTCDDPKCIYGHRCPQSEVGKKECHWGSSCRFEPAQHGIDLNVVKVTKI
ncbi:CCCH zinc finger protein [Talaromyces stipitatus ATCC 10500]|uniref:CCCH zinc finger protein n=1 Tax=Talaromyces stipitatus (strain ATCC 10500 / CBS 375.48 / QM 6759 / NRRL 1006) TaxID=441959 RepID=B8MQ02_TALSN|nr:CCCH zinc finger protein [Talaromyces stipitatus ATCC 10500]EED12892.1 CCCH zinc finger protein [Talaromyces stipitatus ATCC 10500]